MKIQLRQTLMLVIVLPAIFVIGDEREETTKVWQGQLTSVLEQADRIVVVRKSSDTQLVPVLWQIKGHSRVQPLIPLIEISDSRSGPVDGCDGDPHILFYKGKTKLAVLSWHHGTSIRWRNGLWQGDGRMTSRSQVSIPRWFAERGFNELQRARENDLARQKKRDLQARSFASFFPKDAQQMLLSKSNGSARDISKDASSVGEQIALAVDDSVKLTVACCQALGVSPTTWTSTGPRERRVLAAVDSVEGNDFHSALRSLQLNDVSQRGLLGAARLYFRLRYDQRLSVEQRKTWTIILASEVVQHGIPSSKPQLLRYLARQDDPAVKQFLYDVARGTVKGDENTHDSYRSEPDLRPGAVLALAQTGDPRAKELATSLLPETHGPQNIAALEISLALMGDPTFSKPQHFQLESYSLGYAGLDAIERFNGTHGMEILVEHATRHPWAGVRKDVPRRFDQITGLTFSTNGQSRREVVASMLEWWKEHGEEFVRERQKGKLN